MNIHSLNSDFEAYKDEVLRIATEIVGDRVTSIKITETVRLCIEGQHSPIDRILTQETNTYINRILTNEFRTQNNIKENDTSQLKSELNDYVRKSICDLPLNTKISEIMVILASAESYDPFQEPKQDPSNKLSPESDQDSPFLKLEQELSHLTVNVITKLVTPENSISTRSHPTEIRNLKTIVPTACRDYFTSLLAHLNPLIRIQENANAPDSLTPLVKQVAWEYIGKPKRDNPLAKKHLFPQPLAGRPADTQQMVVYLLSQLNFRQRQALLLSRFSEKGITDRDIARHIGISVEELSINVEELEDILHTDTAANGQISQDDTSQTQDNTETEEYVDISEDDFLKHYDVTFKNPIEAYASFMFGNRVYASKIASIIRREIANRIRESSNKFNPNKPWEGEGEWEGFRQLTADTCRNFIIQLNEESQIPIGSSLWGKCLETLTFNEYKCLLLFTFFYKRDEGIREVAGILNQSEADLQAFMQTSLKTVLKKSTRQ